MHIRDLNGKSVCILGFGKEGQAMLKALKEFAPSCKITIADKNPRIDLQATNCDLQTGPDYLQHLSRFDVLIKSPGIPPATLSTKVQGPSARMTTPTQIFFDTIADSGATVIGVTGSKGKSTTSSLIAHILKAGSPLPVARCHLIGNIGEPVIAHLQEATPGTVFVFEMSSYQLMDLTVSPSIAVVTSFFPEHLDYHGSLAAYLEAKKHIARFQKAEDVVFFANASAGARQIAAEGRGKKIPFSPDDAPVHIEETKLIGNHNLSNIAAAYLVSQMLDIPKEAAIGAIKTFVPLPHRLQSLGLHDGIEWIDDSISTTPESAIAALDALGDRVKTVILGGQDRGYDFAPLAERLKQSSVQTVILTGESGGRIRKALENTKMPAKIFDIASMEEAVAIAKNAKSRLPIADSDPPIVLLSPASPSYGMFKNFEERGERFRMCMLAG